MRPLAHYKRKAMSVVISTIILSAAILTITLAALFVSNVVLEQQLDQSEFEQAKNSVMTLVDIIEHVAVTPGASGYVTMNIRTSHPNFTRNAGTVMVSVRCPNGSTITVINGKAGALNIGGGRYVGVGAGIERLVGTDRLLVQNASDPLAYVYVIQKNGAWLNMDYSRVRARYMGKYMYYEGIQKVNRSIVRIAFINISFGTIRVYGTGTLNLVARNVRTIVQTFLVNGGDNVYVTVNYNGKSEGPTKIGPSQSTPPVATQTIVYIVRMDVEIATL